MIIQFLSRYRPRYIRSLVYMLQSCEYNIGDYLAWYWRTKDFSRVERRKQLVKTPKAIFLLACAYAVVFLFLIVAYLAFRVAPLLSLILLILAPYTLAYGIIIPLALINLMQKPIEHVLLWRAKRKLALHKGTRIAIAGSFGKTSMREILKAVLSEGLPAQAGKKVASPPFSYNTPLGICLFIEQLKGNEEVLIFELGEYYPGDVLKLCKLIDPQIGVITGVNEAHLEKFGTLEKTTKTIFELAQYLKGKSKEKLLYVNGENELAQNYASKNHILYSREGTGDCHIKEPKTNLTGASFTLVMGGKKSTVTSSLLGLHNVGPLAVAAHIGSRLGLTRTQIEEGIRKTRAFNHRLEANEDKNGVITIDDSYNGNPDGVHAIIEFLTSIKERRRWYVTPGLVEMGARAEEVHREIGRRLAKAEIEKVVLIRNSVTSYIEQGLKEAGYSGEVLWFEDALLAFNALPHLTVKGDIVLLQNDWPDQYA